MPARIVVEVHGDWRTSTRLYGSPARRRCSSRLGDAVAASALRRADAVRTVSPFTAALVRELGVEPTADFPAYMDLEPFAVAARAAARARRSRSSSACSRRTRTSTASPRRGGSRRRASRTPSLRVVGKGTRTDVAESLVRDAARAGTAELHVRPRSPRALDDAWVLVLPSRSEGMGRVLVEAFCRGRGVVGTRAGSIPNLVVDGVSGMLVEPGDPEALADALVRVLSDRALAERLAAGARAAAAPWLQTPEEYAQRMRELVA